MNERQEKKYIESKDERKMAPERMISVGVDGKRLKRGDNCIEKEGEGGGVKHIELRRSLRVRRKKEKVKWRRRSHR